MLKRKYFLLFLIVLAALAVPSITLISCPSIEEEPFDNTIPINGELTLNEWNNILDDIYTKGYFVKLDLSKCKASADSDVYKKDGSDFIFNPSFGSRFGKDLIKSIILPDEATKISDASGKDNFNSIDDAKDELNKYAFRHFTNIQSVTGKNINHIGTFALYNCTTLEEVNFPNATTVMHYAFYNCTSVKKFDFEKLVTIKPSAFENCTTLEKAEFHEVDAIDQKAFMNCKNLTEVSFSKAKTIGLEAFRNCSKLNTARFHNNVNMTIPTNTFRGCVSLENLDIRNSPEVKFGAGALSDIGTSLTLHLFDDDGSTSTGHPQNQLLLGKPVSDETIGGITLKELKIITSPDVSATLDTNSIKSYITDNYSKVKVTVNGK